MKKQFSKIALTFFVLFSLCGCAVNEAPPLPELVIGCDDYRPYCYIDEDGNFAGMSVEIASEACKRMGYQPVFTQIEWDMCDVLLENGNIDCL